MNSNPHIFAGAALVLLRREGRAHGLLGAAERGSQLRPRGQYASGEGRAVVFDASCGGAAARQLLAQVGGFARTSADRFLTPESAFIFAEHDHSTDWPA
jgi:hypothetical protein